MFCPDKNAETLARNGLNWDLPNFQSNASKAADLISISSTTLQAQLAQAREEGFAAGLASAQNEQVQQYELFQALVKHIQKSFNHLYQDLDDALLKFAFKLAEHLIQHTLAADPDCILSHVRNALKQLPLRNGVVNIFLNPDDLPNVQIHANEFNQANLLPDPQLARGDCRIESDYTTVLNQLATNIAEARQMITMQRDVKE